MENENFGPKMTKYDDNILNLFTAKDGGSPVKIADFKRKKLVPVADRSEREIIGRAD